MRVGQAEELLRARAQQILDRMEELDFEVFSRRASVGMGRRLQVAGGGLMKAWAERARGTRR